MRAFAENNEVIELFKEAALRRESNLSSKLYPMLTICATGAQISKLELKSSDPIVLPSRNPSTYRNDVLAKILPRILNPHG